VPLFYGDGYSLASQMKFLSV